MIGGREGLPGLHVDLMNHAVMFGPRGASLHVESQKVVAVAVHLPAIWEDEVGVCLEEHALQPKVGANCFVEIRIPDALTLVVREIEELGRWVRGSS